MNKKTIGFVLGSIVGAGAGVIAGLMLAPALRRREPCHGCRRHERRLGLRR